MWFCNISGQNVNYVCDIENTSVFVEELTIVILALSYPIWPSRVNPVRARLNIISPGYNFL